jgi:prepilin peptidase CpaA
MTIPNRLCAVLAILFLPAALALAMPPAALALHLLAGAVVLLFGVLFFARGWIGGGDAKIAAAAALWLGFDALLPFLTLSALFGGFLTVGIVILRAHMLPAFALRPWLLRLHDPKAGIPYGVAIAAGAIAAFPESLIFRVAG